MDATTTPFNAAAIREWRERMGFSQREAATHLGCSRNSIANWEAGESSIPKYIALACAALALGIAANGTPADDGTEE